MVIRVVVKFFNTFFNHEQMLKIFNNHEITSYLALNPISIIGSFKICEKNSWINDVTENTRLEAEATPGYVTLESRMTERASSLRSFRALRACSNVARRTGCSRVGAIRPRTGTGQAPFQSEALSEI